MRIRGYHLFEIVAWPAAVWYPIEAGLRGAAGDPAGAAWASLFGAMALTMVCGTRLATRRLPQTAR